MKVLIVDDHALIREGMELLLPRLDSSFAPIVAGSCSQALSLLRGQSDIELVLLDLELPDAAGAEGVAAIRREFPDVSIVALSGQQDRDVVLAAIKHGAMGFVPKSYTSDQLFGALQYILLHRGTFLPAELFVNEAKAFSPAAEAKTVEANKLPRIEPRSLGLTDRQADVLYLVLQGKPNKSIARQLGIEDTTVRSHVTAVLRALNVTTRTEAVIAAHKIGLVFPRVPSS